MLLQILFVNELIHFMMLFCNLAQEQMWSLKGEIALEVMSIMPGEI